MPGRDAPLPDAPLPDALKGHWVDTRAPFATRPFLKLARIERPIGWWLLLMPCWWAAGLAAIAAGQPYPNPWHCLLFFVGAVLMRGAGCTFNDIIDRKLDAEVARTRGRPLPSGQVTAKAAALFMVAQALLGLVVLLQFNRFTIVLGIASLVIVAIYPFMKRITNMPQFVLGLAFSWGGLMGWSAVFGRLDAPAYLIYAASIAWTVGYDTIYAMSSPASARAHAISATIRARPWRSASRWRPCSRASRSGWLAAGRPPGSALPPSSCISAGRLPASTARQRPKHSGYSARIATPACCWRPGSRSMR